MKPVEGEETREKRKGKKSLQAPVRPGFKRGSGRVTLNAAMCSEPTGKQEREPEEARDISRAERLRPI